MRCARSSATPPSIASACARPDSGGGFPTADLGEICGWTVDSERVALWMNVWTRSWTKHLVAAQARADDSEVAWKEGHSPPLHVRRGRRWQNGPAQGSAAQKKPVFPARSRGAAA